MLFPGRTTGTGNATAANTTTSTVNGQRNASPTRTEQRASPQQQNFANVFQSIFQGSPQTQLERPFQNQNVEQVLQSVFGQQSQLFETLLGPTNAQSFSIPNGNVFMFSSSFGARSGSPQNPGTTDQNQSSTTNQNNANNEQDPNNMPWSGPDVD
jgi:hypothetical protein